MTTTILPIGGGGAAGPLYTSGGVGAVQGYDAIDERRGLGIGRQEGPISLASYTVGQRSAGPNMSVDIATDAGTGVCVRGDSIADQGLYVVPETVAPTNEVIVAADSINPRIDSVVIEIKDNRHDGSGQDLARTRVITGSPLPGVTNEAPGVSPGALPVSTMLVAYVQVDAGATSITTAKIKDMRPKRRGKSIVASSESRTNTAYGLLATPDRVTQVVLPTDGFIAVAYQAAWSESAAGAARAAIFLGANQVQRGNGLTAPVVQEVGTGGAGSNLVGVLSSAPGGLVSSLGYTSPYSPEVSTGQVLGSDGGGGPVYIFAAAGTYDVSVQFKASSGSVTAKNRHLVVWTIDPDQAVLS